MSKKKHYHSNDPVQKAVRKWLKEGHSPTELLASTKQSIDKRNNPKKKEDYGQFREVPNKNGIKTYKGGGCSPK